MDSLDGEDRNSFGADGVKCPEMLDESGYHQEHKMSIKEKLFPSTLSVNPADFPNIPAKIEALRKIWRKEILDFLDALASTRHIVEPQLSRVLRKLESIIDPDDLVAYCSPTEEGVRFSPIAEEIDIALGEASFQIYDEFPESGSPKEAFDFMKLMYEPYQEGQFENWTRRYN